jgi:hypothetical protein
MHLSSEKMSPTCSKFLTHSREQSTEDMRGRHEKSSSCASVTSLTWVPLFISILHKDAEKADKRKSRLDTSKYLAQKFEISADDHKLIFVSGEIRWHSPSEKLLGGKPVYGQILNGMLCLFPSLTLLSSVRGRAHVQETVPLLTADLSNAYPILNESNSTIKILLLEDEKIHFINCQDSNQLMQWYRPIYRSLCRYHAINEVAYRWGLKQKSEMEYTFASKRKLIGQLWELCTDGVIPPSVQKVCV